MPFKHRAMLGERLAREFGEGADPGGAPEIFIRQDPQGPRHGVKNGESLRMDAKEEWLRYSGWDASERDRWLRDKIAALFDLADPSPRQQRLLQMADLRLTLQDLPSSAYPGQEAELRALAEIEFKDQA